MVDLKRIVTIRWCTTYLREKDQPLKIDAALFNPDEVKTFDCPLYTHLSNWWYSVSFFTCMRTLPWKQTRGLWLWDGDDGGKRALYRYPQYHMPRGTKSLSSLESPLRLQWQKLRVAGRVVTAGCCVSRCKSVASRWKHCKELAKTWISLRLGID